MFISELITQLKLSWNIYSAHSDEEQTIQSQVVSAAAKLTFIEFTRYFNCSFI